MNGPATPGRELLEVVNVGVATNVAGDVEVVAAPDAGHRVVLLGYAGSSAVDNDLDWRSGETSLAGPLPVGARQHVFAFVREGLAACGPGEALVLNTSQAGQVSLLVIYAIERN